MSQVPTLIRTGLAAISTAAAALTFAGPALASTATLAGGTLSVQDDRGHAAVITVAELANPLNLPGLDKVLVDTDTAIDAPAGCIHPLLPLRSDPTAILCDRAAVRSIVLDLDDGDDAVLRPLAQTLLGARAVPLARTTLEVDGGAGNDVVQGGDGSDLVTGGPGDDTLVGHGGDDTLIGDLGADRIEPGTGSNLVDVSSPEVDTVALDAESSNVASASANDVFLGAIGTARITLAGSVGSGGDGGQGSSSASVQVDREPDGGMPSVTDLLTGIASALPGGTVPDGVSLPLQPLVASLSGIAGRLGTDVRLKTDGILPTGIALDEDGLHIEVGCASDCEVLGNGVVDTGDGGVVPLRPATVNVTAQGGSLGKAKLNLGIGTEYTKFSRPLGAGRCAVVVSRLRVRTSRGSEVVSYALPACGAKLTFSPQQRPSVTTRTATRRLTATATCSSSCTLSPRFLLVKSGSRVLARTTSVSVRPVLGRAAGRVHTTTWRLTAAQETAITAARRKGLTKLRYIVSAKATSGGVTTTGTASFRTRGT